MGVIELKKIRATCDKCKKSKTEEVPTYEDLPNKWSSFQGGNLGDCERGCCTYWEVDYDSVCPNCLKLLKNKYKDAKK